MDIESATPGSVDDWTTADIATSFAFGMARVDAKFSRTLRQPIRSRLHVGDPTTSEAESAYRPTATGDGRRRRAR